MPTTLHENRPSAGIGVVEVQKPWFFASSKVPARPSAGTGVVDVQKPMFFLRFLRCSPDPLRGSACSRCKNSRFFRLWLFEVLGFARRSRTGGSRVRFLPGPRAGVARCNLHFKATCAEQLAQSKLHRATCADQLAPTSLRRAPSALPRATCAEQLTQSNLRSSLRRAACTEQLAGSHLQGPACRSNLRGATCAVCAEHLAWCCLALASQMLRGGKKNASCSVRPTSLAMLQPWSSLKCLVCSFGPPLFVSAGLAWRTQ